MNPRVKCTLIMALDGMREACEDTSTALGAQQRAEALEALAEAGRWVIQHPVTAQPDPLEATFAGGRPS
jgi:hypothetical protein